MAKFELWRETSIRQNEWQFHREIYLGMHIFAYNLAGKIFLFKVVKMDLSVLQQKKLPQLLDLSKCKYISIFALSANTFQSNHISHFNHFNLSPDVLSTLMLLQQGKLQGGPQKSPYFSLAITFKKIRKPSRFFIHRYCKFIEFFWWKPL